MFEKQLLSGYDLAVSYEFRNMSKEELLDIWLETQDLEHNLKYEYGAQVRFSLDLEKIIVNELFLRNIKEVPEA